MTQLRPAAVLLVVFTLVLGVVYPLFVTAVAHLAMPGHAEGSLVHDARGVVGSELLGQDLHDPRLFWSRPSATSSRPYDAAASAGSNLGPNNPQLHARVRARVAALRAADPQATGAIPVDLVTASASGLDPHISPASALYQAPRVARARGLPEARVRALVESHIEPRAWGLFGEPRVNVLALDRDLARLVP